VNRYRLAVGVPAGALTMLCLGACIPMHTGAAATVGQTRISVSALNMAVQQSLASANTTSSPGADRTAAVQTSLTTIIRTDLIADAAKAKNVTVTEAEIQDVLATQRQTNGTDENTAKANGIPFANLHQVVYQVVLLDKLEAAVGGGQTDQTVLGQILTKYLGSIAKAQGVSVNPRYGVWQPANLAVGAGAAFTTPQSAVASSPGT
jgi:SurA N-terminal domain